MQSAGDLDEGADAGVATARLDAGDVGPVKISPTREFQLAPTSLVAKLRDPDTDSTQHGGLFERRPARAAHPSTLPRSSAILGPRIVTFTHGCPCWGTSLTGWSTCSASMTTADLWIPTLGSTGRCRPVMARTPSWSGSKPASFEPVEACATTESRTSRRQANLGDVPERPRSPR